MGIQDTKRVSRKTLTDGIIRPRLNEIFTMVRIQLDKENLGSRIPSGIILTGGGAETVGIEESARRMLSLPVRIGKPKGIGGLIDDIVSPVFATPVGLIIYAAGLDAEEVQNPFTSKLKLPSKGLAGKILETIKDLLP